jgi:type IV fimbrial biogenesis protein FimT
MSRFNINGYEHGLTLVELLVTIAIVSILLTIGVPSFKSLLRSSDMYSNTSDMVTAFNYARISAVKNGTSVQISPQDLASWDSGLVVWLDSDDDDIWDDGEELRLWDEFNTSSTVASTNSLTNFTFTASGEVNNSDVLTICDDRNGETGRTINILTSGAVFAEEVTCG